MAREYQRAKNNPYLLPKTVYNRTLWVIRDYERMKAERNEIIHGGGTGDGQPKGNAISKTTENKALKLVAIEQELKAVDEALELVESDLKNGVINNICHFVPYPHYPHRATWWRAKSKFIYDVASNLRLI